jgi:ADP-ribose pyrophosphatase
MTTDLNWHQTFSQTIFKNKWLAIHSNDYALPDGSTLTDFNIVEDLKGDGTTTVAITEDRKVLIVKQFRAPINKITYDLPGGFIEDTNESPLVNAQRELLEETGYASDTWTETGHFHCAPHRICNTQHTFLALNCKKVHEQHLDQSEFVEFELKTLSEFETMIKNNEFICGVCITAYMKAKLFMG